MMLATCHNLDFSACGCSTFEQFNKRSYVKKVLRTVNNSNNIGGYGYGYGGGRSLICCRRDSNIAKYRVFATEAPETLLNGTLLLICFAYALCLNI